MACSHKSMIPNVLAIYVKVSLGTLCVETIQELLGSCGSLVQIGVVRFPVLIEREQPLASCDSERDDPNGAPGCGKGIGHFRSKSGRNHEALDGVG